MVYRLIWLKDIFFLNRYTYLAEPKHKKETFLPEKQ